MLVLDLSAYPLPPAEEALSAGILAPAWMRQQRLEAAQALLPVELRHPGVLRAVEASLAEDLNAEGDLQALWPDPAQGDITSQATLDPNSWLEGRITAKAAGVIAGLPLAQSVFYLVEPRIQFKALVADGQGVEVGALLAEVSGPGPALLAAERPALNFLGRMSGIATLSRRFAEAVAGTKAIVLDTRKTAPGLRHLDKYAVAMGGSGNHRAGLYDMILIKDNHIDGAGGIPAAVERVRKAYGEQYKVEVEVKNLEELQIALSQPIQRIMLDNMSLAEMRQAVKMTAGKVELEASGNVSLATVRAIAETGVDFISSGALTHSAAVLDISLRLR